MQPWIVFRACATELLATFERDQGRPVPGGGSTVGAIVAIFYISVFRMRKEFLRARVEVGTHLRCSRK